MILMEMEGRIMKTIYTLGAALALALSVFTFSGAEARVACGQRGCVSSTPAPGYRHQPRHVERHHHRGYRPARPQARVYVSPRGNRCTYHNGRRVCR